VILVTVLVVLLHNVKGRTEIISVINGGIIPIKHIYFRSISAAAKIKYLFIITGDGLGLISRFLP
jgi:hypothetical protein